MLLLIGLILFSCKKEDENITKVDLLSSPLSSTPLGFSGNVGGNYFYLSDSIIPYTLSNSGTYEFNCDIYSTSSALNFGANIFPLSSINSEINDSEFFAYFKLDNYEYANIDEPIDIIPSGHYIFLSSNTPTLSSNYGTYFGSNSGVENYFTLLDTLHTSYNNSPAIKFRAKFQCQLYNNSGGDSTKVTDGVLVGLFVKP